MNVLKRSGGVGLTTYLNSTVNFYPLRNKNIIYAINKKKKKASLSLTHTYTHKDQQLYKILIL
jgi:hypothetical protein